MDIFTNFGPKLSFKIMHFSSSEDQLGAQICIEKAFDIRFEALEVSWIPKGDQESLKEVSKSSKVTIHESVE